MNLYFTRFTSHTYSPLQWSTETIDAIDYPAQTYSKRDFTGPNYNPDTVTRIMIQWYISADFNTEDDPPQAYQLVAIYPDGTRFVIMDQQDRTGQDDTDAQSSGCGYIPLNPSHDSFTLQFTSNWDASTGRFGYNIIGAIQTTPNNLSIPVVNTPNNVKLIISPTDMNYDITGLDVPVITPEAHCMVFGGKGPYSFIWQIIAQDTQGHIDHFNFTNPTDSSIRWSYENSECLTTNFLHREVWRCTVTDGNGSQASKDIIIRMYHY